MDGKYEDIISLQPPQPVGRAPMPLQDRAAQFAPFAALTGFEGVIHETGRRTETAPELTESRVEELDRALRRVLEVPQEREVVLTWYLPDGYKPGGSLVQTQGHIRACDGEFVYMQTGEQIPVVSITELSGQEDQG